ncbi:MAG TPA: hypothetical protein VE131_16065 [Terriglobales bacterium]|nr:hypothetical protein [Terriglobales bacterium]
MTAFDTGNTSTSSLGDVAHREPGGEHRGDALQHRIIAHRKTRLRTVANPKPRLIANSRKSNT